MLNSEASVIFLRYKVNRVEGGYTSSSVIAPEKGLAAHISFTSISNSFANRSDASENLTDKEIVFKGTDKYQGKDRELRKYIFKQ